MRALRGWTLLVVALTVLAVVPFAEAVPLPGQTGAFGISPARRAVVGNPGIQLTPTTVGNSTGFTYDVTVFPAIVTQTLAGTFTFPSSPRNLNESRIAMSVSPSAFALSPQQSQQVSLHWNALPANRPWLAMGIVFQGVPRHQTSSVRVITRLLSVNFLRLPGPYRVTGDFAGLFPEQGPPRVLRFVARVKNTGQMFGTPSADTFTIRDSRRHVVFSEPWTASIILPGARVDFPILVTKILPAGRYTATVGMEFGGLRTKTVPFTLVGPNELPTPDLTINDFRATGDIGSPARVAANIVSSGTAPASATFRIYLGSADEAPGQPALGTDAVSYQNLPAGSTTKLSRSVGGPLKKGSYRVFLTWIDATGAKHTAQTTFTATTRKSFLQKLWQWIKDHRVLFIGLVVLALLIAMASLVHRIRRRHRQMAAELAAARAAIGSVAAPPRKGADGQMAVPVPTPNPGPARPSEPPLEGEREPNLESPNPGPSPDPGPEQPPSNPDRPSNPSPDANPGPTRGPEQPPGPEAEPTPESPAEQPREPAVLAADPVVEAPAPAEVPALVPTRPAPPPSAEAAAPTYVPGPEQAAGPGRDLTMALAVIGIGVGAAGALALSRRRKRHRGKLRLAARHLPRALKLHR